MDKRAKRRETILSWSWLLIVPVTYVLTLLASANPVFVERVYSGAVYQFVSLVIPFQYIPFVSFFEIVLVLAPLALLTSLIIFIVRLVRNKEKRAQRILKVLRRALIVCGMAYFLFYVTWGFNYYRLPYAEIAHLPVRQSSAVELKELCTSLINRTNEARAVLPSANDSTLNLSLTTAELQNSAREAYARAGESSLPGISGSRAFPKPLLTSKLFSYAGITGIYIPYTAEPNFNNDIPLPLRGATICHELAHREGFAREDEANYLAYLICTNTGDDYLNYSGLLLATIHAMNKLHAYDRESFSELYALYSSEVAADLEAERVYWSAFEGKVEEAFTRVNDNYLRSHNQADGVASYGRMVDLLLAERRLSN